MSRLTALARRAVFSLRPRAPETPAARMETVIIGVLLLAFVFFLMPALRYTRREYRDGLQRQLVRETKTALEQWYNVHAGFPPHPSGDLPWCGSTEDPDDWFFTHFLKRETSLITAIRVPRQRSDPILRYCPTSLFERGDGAPPLASGFFLETNLKNTRAEQRAFNAEHNMFERTLVVDGQSLYRVCGGTETQCGTER